MVGGGEQTGVNASYVGSRASTETAKMCLTSLHTIHHPRDGRYCKEVDTFTTVHIILTPQSHLHRLHQYGEHGMQRI